MKIVLLKDVKGTGKAHTAVEVKDGHALNQLLPRGFAVLATPAALKKAEAMGIKAREQGELSAKLVSERLTQLADEKIVFIKKANEKGHLYDAVDAKEIAEKAQLSADVIHIERPFKELGTFEVPVSYGEQFGVFSITIEAE